MYLLWQQTVPSDFEVIYRFEDAIFSNIVAREFLSISNQTFFHKPGIELLEGEILDS